MLAGVVFRCVLKAHGHELFFQSSQLQHQNEPRKVAQISASASSAAAASKPQALQVFFQNSSWKRWIQQAIIGGFKVYFFVAILYNVTWKS